MISIKQDKTYKLPGMTSLFVQFPYNPEMVDAMHSVDSALWHKKLTAWEVPLNSLSHLIDALCVFDDIVLQFLDEKESDDVQHSLVEFKTKLFDHQQEAVQFGLNHDSWLLLDDPGLGKTLTMISLAQQLKETQGLQHCFIICGVNALKTNWKKEIERHSNLTARILGERLGKRSGKIQIGGVKDRIDDLLNPIDEFFVITNIETLRNDDIVQLINHGKENVFDMVVLDEIHVCKSPTSQQGKHLLKLTSPKHRIGLTGTLLMNAPIDAYVPLKWIGADRSTYSNFKNYYCKFGGNFNSEIVGYKNTDTLSEQLQVHALRRTKSLLNLPPKTVIDEYLDMADDQKLFYSNIKNGILDQVDKVVMDNSAILASVMRLRQATACPQILSTESISSAKLDRAVDLTEQLVSSGQKVVIFSTFKATVDVLKERLKCFNPLINTGDVGDIEISKNVDLFQHSPEYPVFIGTWQKCGTGLTLNAASYMIFIDRPWTSSQCVQAEDRIYRIGTKNSVFIYNLMCKDTVDEKVDEIIKDKSIISSYIVDNVVPPQLVEKLKKLIVDL